MSLCESVRCFSSVKASVGLIGPCPDTLFPRRRPIGWSLRSPDLSPHSIGSRHGRVSAPSSGWRPVQWSALVLARCNSGQLMGSQIPSQPGYRGWQWVAGVGATRASLVPGAWEHPWIFLLSWGWASLDSLGLSWAAQFIPGRLLIRQHHWGQGCRGSDSGCLRWVLMMCRLCSFFSIATFDWKIKIRRYQY